MDAVLRQLGAIPGVVGSLVFDRSGQVQGNAFPEVFDPAALSRLAGDLCADVHFEEWTRGDHATYELRFSEGWVAVRSVDGAAWLLVVCTAQANAQLVTMSLTQVIRRLKAGAGAAPSSGMSIIGALPVSERLKALVRMELKDRSAQAVDMLSAAGDDVKALLRATTDIEKLTRLFIDRRKAEELGRKMRDILMS